MVLPNYLSPPQKKCGGNGDIFCMLRGIELFSFWYSFSFVGVEGKEIPEALRPYLREGYQDMTGK